MLSGGGSLGAVQVGMLQALAAHGIEPDLLVGTSAGEMNAAWVAAHGTSADSLAGLAEVWTRLRRRDAFPLDVRATLRGLLGRSPAVTSARLHQLVTTHAGINTLEQAKIPVHLVAADLLSGKNVTVSTGPLATGVLASAAIGWVAIDPRNLATRVPNVYALGDCADAPVPRAGVFAETAARAVADDIAATIYGSGTIGPYDGRGRATSSSAAGSSARSTPTFCPDPRPPHRSCGHHESWPPRRNSSPPPGAAAGSVAEPPGGGGRTASRSAATSSADTKMDSPTV